MTDREKQDLRGPVKSVSGASGTTTFNRDGSLQERTTKDAGGKKHRTLFVYDPPGRLRQTLYFLGEELQNRETREYDESGRLARVGSESRDGKLNHSTSFSYDAEGRQTEVQHLPKGISGVEFSVGMELGGTAYSTQGAETVTKVHDADGRPVELLTHNAKHELLSKVVYVHDAQARLVEERQEMQLQNILEASISSISSEELAAVAKSLGPEGFSHRKFNVYDERGLLVETRQDIGALGADKTTYIYDDQRNRIEEVHTSEHGEIGLDEQGNRVRGELRKHEARVFFSYQYDARGNWTQRITTHAQGSSTETRVISYYDDK